jgi:hypothetical protein
MICTCTILKEPLARKGFSDNRADLTEQIADCIFWGSELAPNPILQLHSKTIACGRVSDIEVYSVGIFQVFLAPESGV